MKRNLLLFLLLISSSVFAQNPYTIKGEVRDSLTNELLYGANIIFNKGEKPVISNEQGIFLAKLKSPINSITVRYIGYITHTGKLNLSTENQYLIVRLQKQSHELDEVIVKDRNSLQAVDRPILGSNTLNIKTINKLPMPLGEIDVLKGLQMMPGVSSVGEASNGLNVRGGTTDQNLILLDNAPIFNPTHMFGLFSVFPSDGIANIQLFKGNIPAKYGGRAASVLDVSMSNPSLTKFSLDGGISFVSSKVKFDMPIVKDKIGLMISTRGSFNDFLLPIVSADLKKIKANFGDIAAKLFFKINQKNTLSLSSYYSYDFFQTDLLGTYSNINATATQYRYKTTNISGKWIHILNTNSSLETILVSSNYKPDILLPELNTNNKVIIAQGVDFTQAKFNYKTVKGKNTLESGIDAVHYTISPGELIPGTSTSVTPVSTAKEYGLENGIYITDEVDLSKKLTIALGIRYSFFLNQGASEVRTYQPDMPRSAATVVSTTNYTDGQTAKSYGGLEPRVGIKYSLSEHINLKFGYNLSRQYLQQISNTTTPLPTSRWKLADANILPQVSQLLTAGVTRNTHDSQYQFSIEGYYRHTDNILDYKAGADFLLKSFPETEILQGFNKSYGIELMASKEKGMVTGWINYTYARSFNKVNEGSLPSQQINHGNFYAANYDRPHTFNATIVIGQGKHHDFSFNFTYSTGRPFTTPQGYVEYNSNIFPYFSERNNERIPDYHRLDFAWNIYNPKMNPNKRFKGNWVFSVYNLYGRKNPYSVFYRSEGRVLNAYELVIFGSPIPTLAYKWTFN
jgi:CarboxypepD_reg-like domain/TonB-dependent Receptor Plug Domain